MTLDFGGASGGLPLLLRFPTPPAPEMALLGWVSRPLGGQRAASLTMKGRSDGAAARPDPCDRPPPRRAKPARRAPRQPVGGRRAGPSLAAHAASDRYESTVTTTATNPPAIAPPRVAATTALLSSRAEACWIAASTRFRSRDRMAASSATSFSNTSGMSASPALLSNLAARSSQRRRIRSSVPNPSHNRARCARDRLRHDRTRQSALGRSRRAP